MCCHQGTEDSRERIPGARRGEPAGRRRRAQRDSGARDVCRVAFEQHRHTELIRRPARPHRGTCRDIGEIGVEKPCELAKMRRYDNGSGCTVVEVERSTVENDWNRLCQCLHHLREALAFDVIHARAHQPRLHPAVARDRLRAALQHELSSPFGAEIADHSHTGAQRSLHPDHRSSRVHGRAGDHAQHATGVLVVRFPGHRDSPSRIARGPRRVSTHGPTLVRKNDDSLGQCPSASRTVSSSSTMAR